MTPRETRHRAVTIEIDELRLDAETLHGNAVDLSNRVGRALEGLIEDRGLPTQAIRAGRESPEPHDDAALADHIAELVWQRLVVP
jgi:hypothetical protein